MRAVILGFALMATACQQPEAASPSPLEVRQQAADAFKAYVAALNASDVETARSFYDDGEGFHWIERHAISYTSGTDAANALQPFDAGPGKTVMEIEDLRVADMGQDAAFASARIRFTIILPGGDFMDIPLWMSVGLKRQPDGWKFAAGMVDDG